MPQQPFRMRQPEFQALLCQLAECVEDDRALLDDLDVQVALLQLEERP